MIIGKEWKKEQVCPFFVCCTVYLQTDAGRHQLYRDRRQDVAQEMEGN